MTVTEQPTCRDQTAPPTRQHTPALIEICVDSADGARIAEAGRADRIELCGGLREGGTTPSIGCVRHTLETVRRIGVQVLIRPRGGDFLYSRDEVDVMLADIEAIRALPSPPGVPVGFAIGALTADGHIDTPTVWRLIDACADAPVTFHRAFDMTRDLPASLDVLADLGVDRVLTSGGRPRAIDGVDMLRALCVRADGGHPIILAGGGVRASNVAALVEAGVREVHLRAARTVESAMSFRRGNVPLSAQTGPSDYMREVTSGEVIADLRRALSPASRLIGRPTNGATA